jgi:oligopeptide transport system permease protein
MLVYIMKRAAWAVVTLFFIICLTFLLMNTIPGSPFLDDRAVSPQVLAELQAKYGLDKPLPVQLKNYITRLLSGDMGLSLKMQRNRPVAAIITEMFPVSARIGLISLLWAAAAGIALGCISAYRRGKWQDKLLQALTTLGIAFPGFVVATLLLVCFAGGIWHIFPTGGLVRGAASYVLPCLTLGLAPMCSIARYTRSSMLDVLNKPYIKTVRFYGFSNAKLIFKYALRNALIPIVTYIGPVTAGILTGSFVVETVFNIPGLGRYFVQSITSRDYPIIMGTTIFFAALVICISLLVDILYKIIDPRIKLANEK